MATNSFLSIRGNTLKNAYNEKHLFELRAAYAEYAKQYILANTAHPKEMQLEGEYSEETISSLMNDLDINTFEYFCFPGSNKTIIRFL